MQWISLRFLQLVDSVLPTKNPLTEAFATCTAPPTCVRNSATGVPASSAADYLAIAAGIGNVTFPVAAHSAPRANVVMNAGV